MAGEELVLYPCKRAYPGPDVILCTTETVPCFIRRTIDVGEELECGPDLLEEALRVYQGRVFCDGTGELRWEELDRLTRTYDLIVL